jgi:triacylglycerol esterase/lipase EstA (alpha/beta hydrolase family)
MEESARQLADFVDRVLAATGTHRVDIVGRCVLGLL